MRSKVVAVVTAAIVAGACAAPVDHEIACQQVAVGERIIVVGAPEQTSSEWGFILDTVRWTADNGISVVEWRLGGDLDNDALEAVIQGEAAGTSTLMVDYTQLSREGVGPVRSVSESCAIKVVEPPDRDLSGTWRMTREVAPVSECAGGPTDGTVDIDIEQDSSGNLVIEGLNTGYEAWTGAVDGSDLTFGGLRDESADLGGGTTSAEFVATATSRTRMNGTETWSWSAGAETCDGTSELTFRKR